MLSLATSRGGFDILIDYQLMDKVLSPTTRSSTHLTSFRGSSSLIPKIASLVMMFILRSSSNLFLMDVSSSSSFFFLQQQQQKQQQAPTDKGLYRNQQANQPTVFDLANVTDKNFPDWNLKDLPSPDGCKFVFVLDFVLKSSELLFFSPVVEGSHEHDDHNCH